MDKSGKTRFAGTKQLKQTTMLGQHSSIEGSKNNLLDEELHAVLELANSARSSMCIPPPRLPQFNPQLQDISERLCHKPGEPLRSPWRDASA